MTDVAKQVEEQEKQQREDALAQGDTIPQPDADSPVPEIIVRTKPTSLILVDGAPSMEAITGTDLLYVSNTEDDIIMAISSQQYYVLISGRWYAAGSLDSNDWTWIPNDNLPADFAKIPEGSDIDQVLASVAGTQAAKEAVLSNSIPQTAEVDRKTARLTVSYDGDPKFESCSDDVYYAVNTDKPVLLVENTYYCCDSAIWFLATGPNGPWSVATSVPAQIQDIPPECPVYNVKYVYIYDSTPEVVYVGYTPGYTTSYVSYGCLWWGTGWWYRPWYHHYYYPHPATFGFRVHWNPWTGWGFSFGLSYGWFRVGFGRPWYGGFWGPMGYRHGYRHGYRRGYRHGYHHGMRAGYRAGYRAGQRSGHHNNMYRNQKAVRNTGASHAARKQPAKANTSNNVHADRNGNVHRNQGGNWQSHNNQSGNWSNSKGSSNMQRSQNQRNRGNQNASRSRGGGGGRRR
jgi:hypothetical protein